MSLWLHSILSTGEPLLRHLLIQNLDVAHRCTPPSWLHVNENTYCPGVIPSSFSLYLSLSHWAWNNYHFTTDVTKWHAKTFFNHLMPVGFQKRISLTKYIPPPHVLTLLENTTAICVGVSWCMPARVSPGNCFPTSFVLFVWQTGANTHDLGQQIWGL